jgi:hypothetical protein
MLFPSMRDQKKGKWQGVVLPTIQLYCK